MNLWTKVQFPVFVAMSSHDDLVACSSVVRIFGLFQSDNKLMLSLDRGLQEHESAHAIGSLRFCRSSFDEVATMAYHFAVKSLLEQEETGRPDIADLLADA